MTRSDVGETPGSTVVEPLHDPITGDPITGEAEQPGFAATPSPPAAGRSAGVRRLLGAGPTAPVLAVLSYMLLALWANWPAWPGDPSDYRPGDLTGSAWDFSWLAHVVLHPQNPFFTNGINFPFGENIAQAAPTFPLGLISLPLTLAFGPLSTLNLWLWLAYPASAASAYLVLRRFGVSRLGAYFAGLLYGFSPYMTGQGLDHLNLVFMPLPPLIFYVGYRVFEPGRRHNLRRGALLGLLIAAQFYVTQEVVVSTLVFLVIGLLLLAVFRFRRVPAALRAGLPAAALGAAVTLLLVGYPIWEAFKGPQHYVGSVGAGLGADLLGTITPTSLERFVPSAIATIGNRLVLGDVPENGSYLSIPIVVACLYVAVRYFRDPWVRLAGAMTVLTVAFSLGAYLTIDGHATTIPMPAWLLYKAPALTDLAEVRFSGYTFFFAGALIARGFDLSWSRVRSRPAIRRHRRRRPMSLETASLAVLAVAGLVLLVPRWPDGAGPAGVPAYFQSAAVRSIPPGATVLISPYPSVAEVAPMLWQADAGFRFKMVGGYVLVPGTGGHVSAFPNLLPPVAVENYLWQVATSGTPPAGTPPQAQLVGQFRIWLRRYHIDAVLSSGDVANAAALDQLFTDALGQPSYNGGGIEAWYDVPSKVS